MNQTSELLPETTGARTRTVPLGCGLLLTATGRAVGAESVQMVAHCTGPASQVGVVLNFVMDGDQPVETAFVFPLPNEVSLLACNVTLNGNTVSGSIRPRTTEETRAPAAEPEFVKRLLEGERDRTLTVFLGNRKPGDQVCVELAYACPLETIEGRYLFRFPLKVDPKLGSVPPPSAMELTVLIESGGMLLETPVATQPTTVREMDGDVEVSLNPDAELRACDFVVSFRLGMAERPQTWLRTNGEFFLFGIFPPTAFPAPPQRRDLVMLIDASDNLLGEKFKAIVDGVSAVLGQLESNDRFALVTFGREVDGYRGGEFCVPEEAEQGREWLQLVKPGGRADVAQLLERILTLPAESGRHLCVILIAGGHVGNEPEILKAHDFDQSDRRFYTLGVGPAANSAFLRRLALRTGGTNQAAPDGCCTDQLTRLINQTRALLFELELEDVDLEFDQDELVPSVLGCVTPAGPVHCLGRGSGSAVKFRSRDETGVVFTTTVEAESSSNPALGPVWACCRAQELSDQARLAAGARREGLLKELLEISMEHGVLSRETLLVMEGAGGLVPQLHHESRRWTRRKPEPEPVAAESAEAEVRGPRKGLVAKDATMPRPGAVRPGLVSKSDGEPKVPRGMKSIPDKPVLRPRQASGEEEEAAPVARSRPPVKLPSHAAAAVQAAEDEPETLELEVVDEAREPDTAPSDEAREDDEQEAAEVEVVQEVPEAPSAAPEPEEAAEAVVTPAPAPAALEPEEVAEAVVTPAPTAAESEEVAEAVVTPAPTAAEPEEAAEVVGTPAPVAAEPETDSVVTPAPVETAPPEAQRSRADDVAPPEAPVTAVTEPVPAAPVVVVARAAALPQTSRERLEALEARAQERRLQGVLASLRGLWEPSEGRDVDTLVRALVVGAESSVKAGFYSEAVRLLEIGLEHRPGDDILRSRLWHVLLLWAQHLSDAERLADALFVYQSLLELSPGNQRAVEERKALLERWKGQASELAARLEAVASPPVRPALPEVPDRGEEGPLPRPAPVPPRAEQVAVAAAAPAAPSEAEPTAQPEPPTAPEASTGAGPSAETQAEAEPAASDEPGPSTGEPEPPAEPESPEGRESSAEREHSVGTEAETEPEPSPEPSDEPQAGAAEAEPVEAEEPETPSESEVDPSYEYSLEELAELLQANPLDNHAHQAVLRTVGDDERALVGFYRDLASNDTDVVEHTLSLARAYVRCGKHAVAIVQFNKFLRQKPTAEAYRELAACYTELGKEPLAKSALKQADKLS